MPHGLRGTYSQRLKRWFDSFGFKEDPFAAWKAEAEERALSSFFVDRPYLYGILGNPAAPQAAFLMAGRGCGKTATWAMVAYECRHGKFKGQVLSVPYTDFTPLLDFVGGDVSRVSVHHHIRIVLRFALKAMIQDTPAGRLQALSPESRSDLAAFAREFADPKTRSDIAAVAGADGPAWEWGGLSPGEVFELFCRLVKAAGWQSVYVLVDRVDETPATASGPDRSADLLQPLVVEQRLLEVACLAFKFFLSPEVGAKLETRVPIARDRMFWDTISWDAAALEELVQVRLRYFSNDQVVRFEDLCATDARYAAMDRLLKACQSSPRTLLRLCRAVVQLHVEQSATGLLSRRDIAQGIAEFSHQLELERQKLTPGHERLEPAAGEAPSPDQGIFLDGRGHVWVDGVEMDAPPSALEMRLLEALYYKAPTIVGNEELIRAVWGARPLPWDENQGDTQDQDETNLRKLVARLRARLDAHMPGSAARFIHNRRGLGYYLRTK